MIKKVTDACTCLRANLRAGNLGRPGSKRRTKATGKPIVFRPDAAQPFDDRCLSWQHDARTVSIWTCAGRLNRHRRRQAELRRKESRQAADINHCISKRIVTEAERTCRGIGLQDLSGIRQRARLRKPQRVMLHSWAFAQLGSFIEYKFIEYKARRAGVPVVFVDARNTSRECADCHHIDTKNRTDQATFACRGCGVVAHADRNASRNIAHRATLAWNAGRQSSAPAPSR